MCLSGEKRPEYKYEEYTSWFHVDVFRQSPLIHSLRYTDNISNNTFCLPSVMYGAYQLQYYFHVHTDSVQLCVAIYIRPTVVQIDKARVVKSTMYSY